MAKNYTHRTTRNVTPRNVSTRTREDQVLNAAGGYVFKADDMTRLDRFLILGTLDGTYYTTARKLTFDNTDHILKMLKSKPCKVIDRVVEVSKGGRARFNDPAIYVLALAATSDDKKVRRMALGSLQDVCRISTHLFTFLTYVKNLKGTTGWGRGLRNAISHWYNDKSVKDVAYQICKYPQRKVEGDMPWSHRDVLRKAHVVPNGNSRSLAFQYAIAGSGKDIKTYIDRDGKVQLNATQPLSLDALPCVPFDDVRYLTGHIKAKNATTVREIISLIDEYGLVRESIPQELYNTKTVMEHLLYNMPLTQMIRTLNKMTELGVLTPFSDGTKYVCGRFMDEAALKGARLHPMQLLMAMKVYNLGHGIRGSLRWTPVPAISDVLENAFYKSFQYVQPTGKNILLGIDMSGSMGQSISGCDNLINTVEGAAVMAMVIARTEPNHHLIGFDTRVYPNLGITASDKLSTVMKKIRPQGGTDCSVPVNYAMSQQWNNIDTFVILTDNESWGRNSNHPYQSVKKYRQMFHNPNTQLAVVSMTATRCSIADPNDVNMLDIVGFDTNVPVILNTFISGY